MTTDADRKLAKEWAALYRLRGLNPLPSREDQKRPFVRYADLWDQPAPPDLFDRYPTSNIQVMTGRHWRLIVIDLDGAEAISHFATLGTCPRTWVVTSGGGGRHLWFRLPDKFPRPLKKAVLWKGEGSHSAIERLCDQSLVMAPPSIHPTTGRRYRWAAKGQSPFGLAAPAMLPRWILALPVVRPEKAPTRTARQMPRFAVHDPVGLAQGWGLRVAGRARSSGWVPCHAFDRDDDHPSAAIHEESGFYVDSGSGNRLRFPELAVALGAYFTVEDAARELRRHAV